MIIKELMNITYEIGDRKLFDIEHLQIRDKERIGLVGRNGSGKTTLLEIIAGKRNIQSATISGETSATLLPQLKRTDTVKSGGEITQQYIDKALARKTELLLADEPTTNLDTSRIERMERTFERLQGAVIIVSHDRAFLDATCETIWEIADGNVDVYKGNYSDFARQKELKIQEHEKAYENYVQKKQQLEDAIVLKEKKAERATKKPKSLSSSEARLKGAKPYFAKKQKKLQQVAKSIETRIEKLERVEKVKELPPIKMTIPNQESLQGRTIIRADAITQAFGKRVLWNEASFQIKAGEKIAVIGENGSGKTTLIKKVINEESGLSISPAVKLGYFSQNLDGLDPQKSILETVMETAIQDESIVRTVLARLHFFRDTVYKQMGVLSGGERVKVALAKLMVSDCNTLILDEPTNFLDIYAMEELGSLLEEYEGTILFVSHDRMFTSQIAERILAIENKEIIDFHGGYEEFKNRKMKPEVDTKEQELLVIETKISEVLSKLSLEPSETLDKEFQSLLKEKRKLLGK
ncbi:Vga family ABC-F type ribosomal protection protein [Oceanobacillus alkalisoli]|uniref:Vga family ABC-F type ribosomal protection protein n=1 Tax=Oceanobacillus alkalisoli TaxID=2925113 RepID=UPI001EE3BA32|nr:ABC-F type ribosomal protection protein [Oceanobacillus alkalisoli]MCG5104903.1 ABC-F type ribosomal protection protein [Oceanobacillus alkalisoli]